MMPDKITYYENVSYQGLLRSGRRLFRDLINFSEANKKYFCAPHLNPPPTLRVWGGDFCITSIEFILSSLPQSVPMGEVGSFVITSWVVNSVAKNTPFQNLIPSSFIPQYLKELRDDEC